MRFEGEQPATSALGICVHVSRCKRCVPTCTSIKQHGLPFCLETYPRILSLSAFFTNTTDAILPLCMNHCSSRRTRRTLPKRLKTPKLVAPFISPLVRSTDHSSKASLPSQYVPQEIILSLNHFQLAGPQHQRGSFPLDISPPTPGLLEIG